MSVVEKDVCNQVRSKFNRFIFPDGAEPDPRFTLANERTFLANIRTCLAVLAGAIALHALPSQLIDATLQRGGSVLLVCIAMIGSVLGCVHWVRTERAMRSKAPLPIPLLAPCLALLIGIMCVVSAVLMLTGGEIG